MHLYYVRVSTQEQKTDRQLVAYEKADRIFIDKKTGSNTDRPELKKMLEELQEGDKVVVKSLDRLSRSTKDLLDIVSKIESKKATLKILDKSIDTSDAIGKFFLTILGAVAELELSTIKQRQREGVAVAKEKGLFKGRKKGSISLKGERKERFLRFYTLGFKKTELAKEFNVTRATIYSWINNLKNEGEIE